LIRPALGCLHVFDVATRDIFSSHCERIILVIQAIGLRKKSSETELVHYQFAEGFSFYRLPPRNLSSWMKMEA